MKKILFTVLAVLTLFSLAACKRSHPVGIPKQMADVTIANGAKSSDIDDCYKAQWELRKFYSNNIGDWKKGIKDMKANGKSYDEVKEISGLNGNGCSNLLKGTRTKCHIFDDCLKFQFELFGWVSELYH